MGKKLTWSSLFRSPKRKRKRAISRSETSSSSESSTRSPRSVLVLRRELEGVLRRLGPSEEEVAVMLAEAEKGGMMSLEEIGRAVPARRSDLREAFGAFDADGDGRISAEELMGMFAVMGEEKCTIEDCRRMIGGVDSDGDGFVCFEDFVRMMDGQG